MMVYKIIYNGMIFYSFIMVRYLTFVVVYHSIMYTWYNIQYNDLVCCCKAYCIQE